MKQLFLFLSLSVAGLEARCQTFLSFCTYVDNEQCIFDNTRFITSPDSSHAKVFMYLRSYDLFNTPKFTYKIFTYDRLAEEIPFKTIEQEVKPDWRSAWQYYTFPTPSKYIVRVYKNGTELVATKSFELFLH